jgi:hypothetical protein
LARAWNWIRERVARHLGAPIRVLYDSDSAQATAHANFLRAIDVFRRVTLAELPALDTSITREIDKARLAVETPSGMRQGFDALKELAAAIPLLWPLAILRPFGRARSLGVGRA